MVDEVLYECPHCGEEYTYDESHDDCPEEPAGFDDGRCAMCNQPVTGSFLDHLKHECEVRGEEQELEEPEPNPAATADGGDVSWKQHPMFDE